MNYFTRKEFPVVLLALLLFVTFPLHAINTSDTRTINVTIAGKLSTLLPKAEQDYVVNLTVTGKLNGSDIVVLQDMASNKMRRLDMSGSYIVTGGSAYYTRTLSGYTQTYLTKANVIGSYMFDKTKVLKTVILPESVTTIESGAFGYGSLQSITIGPNVTSITAGLCAGTTLDEIILNGTDAFILENGILYDKDKTTVFKALAGIEGDITLPSTVITIQNSSFSGTGLRSIIIPSNVTEIKTATFSECNNLENVSFPTSLTDLGYDCFGSCSKLKNIDLSGTKITRVYMSFYNCQALEEVLLPSTLKEITGSSFTSRVMKKITCLATTPPTLEDASYSSFQYSSIASSCKVYVPKGRVNTYKAATGWKRFSNIYEIGSIPEDNITPTPGSKEINGIYYLFDNDSRTATVTYRGTISGSGMNTQYDLDFTYYKGDIIIPNTVTNNGVVYTVKYIGRCAFYKSTKLKSIKMPDTITEIQLSAFSGCTGLETVTFGQGLERIMNGAFWGCSSMNSPEFPNSLKYIENHAFPYCIGITNLKLPDDLTEVAWNTFLGCTGLCSVTLGKNIKNISSGAFSDCSKLSVIFIPKKVQSISHSSFSGCSSLTAIDVESENTIYSSVGGVLFDKAVTHLLTCPEGKEGRYDIPSTVTEIGEHGDTFGAFCNCAKLTEVSIPNSVTFLGWMAFSGCTSLKKVVSYVVEPFEFDEKVFSTWINGTYEFSSATLYIPKDTKSKYLTTPYWYNFSIIEEMEDNPVCDADDAQRWIENLSNNEPVEMPLCDEPTIDDDVEVDDVQLWIDGTDKDPQLVIAFIGGCFNIHQNAGMSFKSVSFASKDAVAVSQRAAGSDGGIRNSGMLAFDNCTFLPGNYTIENSGAAYIHEAGTGCFIVNRQGGRIYITSALKNNVTVKIESCDVETGIPVILGADGYTLTASDASHIHLMMPVGYEWKLQGGGIVINSTSGVQTVENSQLKIENSYDLQGREVKDKRKGLRLQRMSDGTVRKFFSIYK